MKIEEGEVLARARFSGRLVWFWYLQGAFLLAVTVVGIPLLPFWLLGGALWYGRRARAETECVLTRRALHLRRGLFFRQEKTLPLDKIQDLTWHQDPLMRLFGIEALKVETAGAPGTQVSSEAGILGIEDAREFRDRVLAARDAAVEGRDAAALLAEIRDTLRRMEGLLGGRA